MTSDTVAWYDRNGAEWFATHNDPGYWEDELAAIAALVPGGRVLDVGCGPGIAAGVLQARGLKITGIDASGEMIRQARAHVPAADFRHLPWEQADQLDAEPFDGWLSMAALGVHVHPGQLTGVLRTVLSVVKPGGTGLITMKPAPETAWGLAEEDKTGLPSGRWRAVWNPGEFAACLEQAGLEITGRDTRPGGDYRGGSRGWECFLTRSRAS
jgi:SAM-dependent methyltransferase